MKNVFVLALIHLLSFSAFSETVLISQFVTLDKDNKKIELKEKPSKKIYDELTKEWFNGLLQFNLLSKEKYGEAYTILDANKICSSENKNYLLYGYIQKNANSYFANLKLYSATEKKIVKEFFASDDTEHYDRLLGNLSRNIIEEFRNLFALTDLVQEEKKMREVEVNLPMTLFYWNPIDEKWTRKLLGVMGTSVGVEFYPKQPDMVLQNVKVDFFARLNIVYSIGINHKKVYPFVFNSLQVASPAFVHFHFTDEHSFYFGLGPFYEINFMNIKQRHEDDKLLYENACGLNIVLGYEYFFNERVSFFGEIDFDFLFKADGLILIKSIFGVNLNVFRK